MRPRDAGAEHRTKAPTPQRFIDTLNALVRQDELYRQMLSRAEARLVPDSASGYDVFDGSRRLTAASIDDMVVIGLFSQYYAELEKTYR